jgi:D-alanyl-D-alanine carboxypeptidase
VAKTTSSTRQRSVSGFIGAFARGLAAVAMATAVLAATPALAAKPAGIVIDANTGKILYSDDAGGRRYPASLTKMMTLYLVFEALESGKIRKSTPVVMTPRGAAQQPSKLGLRAGKTFTVEQGILSLVTRSANDVATSFGEFLAGNDDAFGRMMTAKARSLGMRDTIYVNANGLPDKRQVTTARDQALLGIALRQHFPQYYPYFSTRSFRFGKQVIGNHNHLLGKVQGVDGIKTGYTGAAGFNLATSARSGGHSLVVVVLGEPSARVRDARVAGLVKRYLPNSASGRRTLVIAKGVPANIVAQPVHEVAQRDDTSDEDTKVASDDSQGEDGLPSVGPLPVARYNATPIETAYADDGAKAPAPFAEKPALVREMKRVAKVEVPADIPAPAKASPQIDKVTTASTSGGKDGWVIQVGTSPSQKQAKELLQKAQEKGGKVLRSADAYTMAFNSEGAKVYRARFSGFHNQDSAVKACKVLKRHGMGCWASLN